MKAKPRRRIPKELRCIASRETGDSGRLQPNYSSLGGSLVSSALSNAYYPQSNRGVGLVFGAFAIGTAERVLNSIAQEFILPRFTHRTWQ
jgi:hypothetical protein